MEFKACRVRGSRVTTLDNMLAEFQNAPRSMSEEVRRLEGQHNEYEELLAHMVNPGAPSAEETSKDPRNTADLPA